MRVPDEDPTTRASIRCDILDETLVLSAKTVKIEA
jgi:hypothetical protein